MVSCSEGLAGPVVEAVGDAGKVSGGVPRKGGGFGQVLAQQPVGVLVGAALPGLVRIAAVDPDAGGDGELGVEGHLLALVPGDDPGAGLLPLVCLRSRPLGAARRRVVASIRGGSGSVGPDVGEHAAAVPAREGPYEP